MKIRPCFLAVVAMGLLFYCDHGTAASAQEPRQAGQGSHRFHAEQSRTPSEEAKAEGAAMPASLESSEKAKASSLATETELFQAIRLQLDQYRKPSRDER